ncbi:ABC transporter substrate-binding protein, partial [Rhodovulum sulfidophilum]|nr:ABC transporter substrate-binding protein [Rhodovulum sulfidophilum]
MTLHTFLTTSALALSMASAAAAQQTLVYCSEGSPEGFDPALYTSGTTFDAAGQAVYARLVEFKTGTTR